MRSAREAGLVGIAIRGMKQYGAELQFMCEHACGFLVNLAKLSGRDMSGRCLLS